MTIDIQNETLIAFRDLPDWCKQHLGRRLSPSTLHRWRLRGCRGVKLETILVGGTRTTSADALARFFDATTRAEDGDTFTPVSTAPCAKKVAQAEAYLAQEGF